MGKRLSDTARLEPGPIVETFVTIVPLKSQSHHRHVRWLITADEKPIFAFTDNLSSNVLWNLSVKASEAIRIRLMPQISRYSVWCEIEGLTEKVSSKRCFVSA